MAVRSVAMHLEGILSETKLWIFIHAIFWPKYIHVKIEKLGIMLLYLLGGNMIFCGNFEYITG